MRFCRRKRSKGVSIKLFTEYLVIDRIDVFIIVMGFIIVLYSCI